uniref:Uncharacterized protein n=1 Tax=Nelumbo nucifera TaxID=4432 RepID=A0A822XP49_NELNU|nr:TPA_asm: hypothetical protein HUJ06_023653 [Nelumbo nucifera]
MEKSSSSFKEENHDKVGFLSCWGRLKHKLSWPKRVGLHRSEGCNFTAVFRTRQPNRGGGFRFAAAPASKGLGHQ